MNSSYRSLFSFLHRVIRSVFGSFSWTPPVWISSILLAIWHGLCTAGRLLNQQRKLSPRRFWSVVAGILVALAAGGYGYWWYENQPKPLLLTVTSSQLYPTPLVKDAKVQDLVATFSGSAAPLSAIGKPITTGLTVSPKLDGEWRWTSDREIVFTPKSDWEVSTEYRVSFDRTFLAPQVRLDDWGFNFKTPAFTVSLAGSEFHEDPVDPKAKNVITTLKFTHPIDKADFEKRLSYRMRVDPLKTFDSQGVTLLGFRVVYDEFGGTAWVHSTPITIPPDEGEVLLTIGKGVRSARGGNQSDQSLEQKTAIPGVLNYFQVNFVSALHVKTPEYDTEQVVNVGTSVAIAQSELAKNIEVYQLPVDRPAFQDFDAQPNYYWSDPSIIGPEVLSRSAQISPEWISSEHDFEKVQSFKHHAPPGAFLFVRIKAGLHSFGDYALPKAHATVLSISLPPKEVRVMGDGAILSLSGGKTLSVLTRDVPKVTFEVGRILPGALSALITQSQGNLRAPAFYNYNFGYDDITSVERKSVSLPGGTPGKAQYTAFDFTPYLTTATQNRGVFHLQVGEFDEKSQRFLDVTDHRLILITDLGVLAKDALRGTHDVFVQSLQSGEPVAGALVKVLGRNGLPILQQATDPQGHVSFPVLDDFKREREPVAYLVEKGSDVSFLPFRRADRQLNLTRFDIGGASSQALANSLEAVLFTDRGIYRPGDEIHVGMIVKSTEWQPLVEGMPFEIAVTDPRGVEITSRRIGFKPLGFEEFSQKTLAQSPTGGYHFSLYLVEKGQRKEVLGSTVARVEEFLPDRMNIKSKLSAPALKGWVSPKELSGVVTLANLYGAPSENHKVRGTLLLSPSYPSFPGFSDYRFYDPLRGKLTVNEPLGEFTTDAHGEVSLPLHLEKYEKATYRLTVFAEGFELEGGRSVSTSYSSLVSPLDYLVGFKPDGDLGFIHKDAARSARLIALGPDLTGVDASSLLLDLVELRYLSVLTQQPNGSYAYQTVRKEVLKRRSDLAIPSAGMDLTLPTGEAGNFVYIVRLKDETELNRIPFTIVGRTNLSSNLERNAELEIRLNKSDFAAGEDIELSITSPYTGAGLITIEKDKVYAWKWFNATSTSSVEHIKVPEELEGNGYVQVTFVRALDSKEIFMSPLSYGVVPFSVDKARRTQPLTIVAPEKLKPGETCSIKFSSVTPGKVAVFAVDEGILQVARYHTPDPLSYFLRKRALEVQTLQILDLLLPEISVMRSLAGPGGDEDALLARNLNPFKRKTDKPVAFWSGIVDVGPQASEFNFEVPDYFNGTLRIMAVSVSQSSVGVTEQKALVRGPFVLNPNVPTFLAPGDEAEISLVVARSDDQPDPDAEVNVSLASSERFEALSPLSIKIPLAPGKEQALSFKIRAGKNLGSVPFLFEAGTQTLRSKLRSEMSIRPSVPFATAVQSGFFQRGLFASGSVGLPVTRTLYPEHRSTIASASTFPVALADGLVSYLRGFPHGCSEQIVSQVFPDVLLLKNKAFTFTSPDFAARYERVLSILRSRQNDEGAFGYWTAGSSYSDFQTLYGLHFMIEAAERGLSVPSSMRRGAEKYVKTLFDSNDHSLSSFRSQAYAAYLLTRGGLVTTNYLTKLQESLQKYFPDAWKKDISAAFIAASLKILKLDREAEALIKNIPVQQETAADYQNFYDQLLRNAEYLFLLARHFPERARDLSGEEITGLLTEIRKGSFNTLSSAYTVLALDSYVNAVGTPANAGVTMAEVNAAGEKGLGVPAGAVARSEFSEQASKIRFVGEKSLPIFYQVSEAGFDTAVPSVAEQRNVEITRELRNEKGEVITSAKRGDTVQVHLVLRSTDNQSHSSVAVIDLLPGGAEVVMPLSAGSPVLTPLWNPEYVDVREDRVVLYGWVRPEATHYFYQMKLTQRGVFDLPPLVAESMYDRGTKSHSAGGKIRVE